METWGWLLLIAIATLSVASFYYINNQIKTQKIIESQSVLRWQALFEQTNDAVIIIRLDQQILAVNRRVCDLLGYSEKELIGKSRRDILSPEDWEDTMLRQFKILSGTRIPAYERKYIKKDGDEIWVEASTSLVIDTDGKPIHIQSIMRDITERKTLEFELQTLLAEMELQAMTDHLTGLLNRRALAEHAKAELNRAARGKKPLSILLLDIDDLKHINDKYGHLVGDEAIKSLAESLNRWKRLYDWIGRWGGDEFMVLLPGVNVADAEEVAKRLYDLVGEIDLKNDAEDIKIQISIGVAYFEGSELKDDSFDLLLSRADEALYLSKDKKQEKVTVFLEEKQST